MSDKNTYDRPDWGILKRMAKGRGAIFVVIIMVALVAFELLNYSTTQFALSGLMGERAFSGIQWATIFALAFCLIDFAGIARIFTPEQGKDEPKEVWYLMGVWLVASIFNAFLTYYAIKDAIAQNPSGRVESFGQWFPFFAAAGVWCIRVTLIYYFSKITDKAVADASRPKQQPQHQIYRPMPGTPYAPPRASYSSGKEPPKPPPPPGTYRKD